MKWNSYKDHLLRIDETKLAEATWYYLMLKHFNTAFDRTHFDVQVRTSDRLTQLPFQIRCKICQPDRDRTTYRGLLGLKPIFEQLDTLQISYFFDLK